MCLLSFFISILLFTSTFGASLNDNLVNPEERIVGGSKVDISTRHFQVALSVDGALCGGSLVAASWVITAAHCTYGISATHITVLAGSNYYYKGGVKRSVQKKYVHPKYNDYTQDYDISLLLLKSPFSFTTTKINKISLALNLPVDGASLVVSGYGTTSSGGNLAHYLLSVTVQKVSKSKCNNQYDGELTETMFCASAQGKDSCQGDSGGPLTTAGSSPVLVGVVSWGKGCASPYYPGVYTNVPYLRPWIDNTTNNAVIWESV